MQVHQEIPKHFAARLRQIEKLDDWSNDDTLVDLHSRMALPLIGETLRNRRESVEGSGRIFWTQWVNNFLLSRISTEMLTTQYMTIMKQAAQGKTLITGIVDPECDPTALCKFAALSWFLVIKSDDTFLRETIEGIP